MREFIFEKTLLVITVLSVLSIVFIAGFIFIEAWPAFEYVDLFSSEWIPDLGLYGVFPMIAASLLVTFMALVIAAPLSVLTAIFIVEFAPGFIQSLFKPVIQTLAGIPSVVYGFFGLTVLVPLSGSVSGTSGFSIFAGAIVLAIMILPTVISLSEDAIRSVPFEYREASYALGLSHVQIIFNIILPCSRTGIVNGIILALGRGIGETLAVLMVIGNVSQFPNSLFEPVRTLTSNIALEMGYAMGIHYNALFATASILFIIIVILMIASNIITYRLGVLK